MGSGARALGFERGELFGEGLGAGAEGAEERLEVEGEAGLALRGDGGGFGARDGDDGRGGLREIEMLAHAQADFVAGEEFGAGPMEDAVQVTARKELDQGGGEIGGGARLAEFVGVEFGRAAGGPVGEQAFMQGATAAGAVAHQERGTDGGRMVRREIEDGLFAGEFLRGVSIYWICPVVRSVGVAALSIEDLFGGEVEKTGVELARELGEAGGQRDVHRLGENGIGIALRGFGDRGAVDDCVGGGGAKRGDERGFVG